MTAVTVTVVAALDGCDNVAVTAVEPPFSGIEEDANDNATVGAASSSAMVNVTIDGFDTPPPDAVAETNTDLSGPVRRVAHRRVQSPSRRSSSPPMRWSASSRSKA